MSTDDKNGWAYGQFLGKPFSVLVESDDATSTGVEVIPALAGHTPYVLGYQFTNKDSHDRNIYLCHTAGASGNTQIGVTEYLSDESTTDSREFRPPIGGASAKNIGIIANNSGTVQARVWGYYG